MGAFFIAELPTFDDLVSHYIKRSSAVNFTQKVNFHSNIYNKFQNVLHQIVPSKINEAKGASTL